MGPCLKSKKMKKKIFCKTLGNCVNVIKNETIKHAEHVGKTFLSKCHKNIFTSILIEKL